MPKVVISDIRVVDLNKIKQQGIRKVLYNKFKELPKKRLKDIRIFFLEPPASAKKVFKKKGWIK